VSDSPVTVSVVLDPGFGARIEELTSAGPVWVTASEANGAAVRACWAKTRPEHNMVTIWSEPRNGQSAEEWLGILDDLDLHHSRDWAGPGIATLQVIGCPLNDAASAALQEFGYTVRSVSACGFTAYRQPPPK
jgi:hypothetical protein